MKQLRPNFFFVACLGVLLCGLKVKLQANDCGSAANITPGCETLTLDNTPNYAGNAQNNCAYTNPQGDAWFRYDPGGPGGRSRRRRRRSEAWVCSEPPAEGADAPDHGHGGKGEGPTPAERSPDALRHRGKILQGPHHCPEAPGGAEVVPEGSPGRPAPGAPPWARSHSETRLRALRRNGQGARSGASASRNT